MNRLVRPILYCRICCIILCTSTLFLPAARSPWAADASPSQIPNGMLLTPASTLQAAEGELRVLVGQQESPLTPDLWQSLTAGEVQFATVERGVQYQFHARQILPAIPSLATEVRVGVLSVTAANPTQKPQTAAVLIHWRQEIGTGPASPPGFLLSTDPSQLLRRLPYERTWNPAWSWFFYRNALLRDRVILYYAPPAPGWEQRNRLREHRLPYRELLPSSVIGGSQFTAQIEPGQQAGLNVYVPFLPVDIDHYQEFVSIIRPGG
jgi:hypothetical protein